MTDGAGMNETVQLQSLSQRQRPHIPQLLLLVKSWSLSRKYRRSSAPNTTAEAKPIQSAPSGRSLSLSAKNMSWHPLGTSNSPSLDRPAAVSSATSTTSIETLVRASSDCSVDCSDGGIDPHLQVDTTGCMLRHDDSFSDCGSSFEPVCAGSTPVYSDDSYTVRTRWPLHPDLSPTTTIGTTTTTTLPPPTDPISASPALSRYSLSSLYSLIPSEAVTMPTTTPIDCHSTSSTVSILNTTHIPCVDIDSTSGSESDLSMLTTWELPNHCSVIDMALEPHTARLAPFGIL
ncbi:hypothetical protein BASA61_001382 [Batrachochytrium salamandrivorans]|nr:hypothetical protein BASA60_003967 [Batrachochytrium salamandrivorans]KAH6602178.1 hypothetical protein BASA61_001382 [Batrachochytrium salamandrivorans]KAH9271859.1 hypothetical protein BASA83_005961 [Batrachochytrium salamandrivorans]